MAELLADPVVQTRDDIVRALAVFDKVRRERGRWLARESRYLGDCYHWLAPGIGSEMRKIERVIAEGNRVIGDVDVGEMCFDARVLLRRECGVACT